MRRRAQLVEATRQRITDAAIRLHTTIGPAATTLSAVADEAGVTRVTLYRHFSTQEELFTACRTHWIAQNPRPALDPWLRIPRLADRLETALAELYRWYAAHGDELFPIYRDMAAMPTATQKAIRAEAAMMVDALLTGADVGGGAARRRLRAAVAHVLSFWTWRSLVVEQGLDGDEALELASQFVRSAIPRADLEPAARH